MNYDFSTNQHQSRQTTFDPYEVLNLPRDCKDAIIRQRFRQLTRHYHPDRNRNNPDYDPKYYSEICAAYEILSDPKQRAAWDQQHAPSWNTLRDASASQQTPVARRENVEVKAKFGDGDLRAFNEQFMRQRAQDPNDRGYGDQMLGRATEADIKRGRTVEAPRNIFGSSNVSGRAFNDRFEREVRSSGRPRRGNSLMEREGEPMGWAASGGAQAYSEICIFDNMVVDREVEDFTKSDVNAGGLNYSDYMSGFSTITEQLPEEHRYLQASGDKKALERALNERISQQSQTHQYNQSFKDAQSAYELQRMEELKKEQERNRHYVMKYRDQYTSDDLLPRARPARPPSRRQRYSSGQQPAHRQGQAQVPPRPNSSNNNTSRINDRLMDRMLDPVHR